MRGKTCCFIGHRKIRQTHELEETLLKTVEALISEEGFDTFLFGSKSEFNSLCYEIVTGLKEKYPHIRRIYVRAEFPYIDSSYHAYLLERYEDTYFPPNMVAAGKAVYVERNCQMINKSQVCILYYSPNYTLPMQKTSRVLNSGTKIAYDHGVKKKKRIINIYPKSEKL